VAAGTIHTVAVTEAGEVFSWGVDAGGRLGHGTCGAEFFPRRLDVFSRCHGAPRVVEVAAGREHSLFRLEDGSVLACGRNEKNQLGLGMRLGHALRRDTSGPCHDEWSSVVAPRLVHGPALEAARQLDPFARVLPWKVELAVRGKREELR